MDFTNIIYQKEMGVGTIAINRPEKRNALNRSTRIEMKEALDDVRMDKNIKGLILKGSGGKSFIAGSDLNELSKLSPIEMEEFLATLAQGFYTEFEKLEKPVIAMIDGLCLGGGLELALSCDIRIASDLSKFGQPEILLGIMPGGGGTQRLSRLVGVGKSKEMIFTGNLIDSTEALQIGLVNKVVPSEKLQETVESVAKRITEQSALALKWAKRSINVSQETNLSIGLGYEALAESLLFSGNDRMEGIMAFFEKRKPKFTDS